MLHLANKKMDRQQTPNFFEVPRELWETFFNYLELKGLGVVSIEKYLYYFSKFTLPVTQESVNQFILAYNNNVARAFVKNYLECFKLKLIEIPKLTGHEQRKVRVPKVCTKEEVYNVARAMPNIAYKLMVLISFQAGLRKQELLAIRPFNFRWNKWKEDPTKPLELVIKKGKGNKQRVVYLSPKIAVAIHNYIMKYRATYDKETPIFPMKYITYYKHLVEVSHKVLGYPISPHALRHSCATYLLNVLRWNIKEVQDYLGHDDLSTTQIYLHSDIENMKSNFSF